MIAKRSTDKWQVVNPSLVFILPNFKLSNTHHLIACHLADRSLTVSEALAKMQVDKQPPFFCLPNDRTLKNNRSAIFQLAP